MKKVLFVFGTRPEAVKMAPMIKELQSRPNDFEVKVCVTGQHREMLDQVLDFFSITPDYDLKVMKPNQTLFSVSADILTAIEPVINEAKPDVILVQGDTTSAFIGALAGYYKQIVVNGNVVMLIAATAGKITYSILDNGNYCYIDKSIKDAY